MNTKLTIFLFSCFFINFQCYGSAGEWYIQGLLAKTKQAELGSEWINHYIKVESEKILRFNKSFASNGDIQLRIIRSARLAVKALRALETLRKLNETLQAVLLNQPHEECLPVKQVFSEKEIEAHINFEYSEAMCGYLSQSIKKPLKYDPNTDLYLSADHAYWVFSNLKNEQQKHNFLQKQIVAKRAPPGGPDPNTI